MKFLVQIIATAILCAVTELMLPWWSIAVMCFLVALFVDQGGGRAFLSGFCSAGLCWLVAAMWHDVRNDHILSARMAALFHLPGYGLFIIVTVVIGGLVGGLAAWSGSMLRPGRALQ